MRVSEPFDRQNFGTPAAAQADGTFTLPHVTIEQPVYTGDVTLRIFCYRTVDGGDSDAAVLSNELSRGVVVAVAKSAFIPGRSISPKLDLPLDRGVVGTTITLTSPCDPGPGGYLQFGFYPQELEESPPTPDVRLYLNFAGPTPVGSAVSGLIPGYQTPGHYEVEATCSQPIVGDLALFRRGSITFLAAAAPTTTVPAVDAPPAHPVAAEAQFTG